MRIESNKGKDRAENRTETAITLAAMERESLPPSMPGPRTNSASLNASHASHIYTQNQGFLSILVVKEL